MSRVTPFAAQELDTHGFLGERIMVSQPVRGYRSGVDTVLLAAACPAKAGERVLDLGCGAGVASFCLATRIEGVTLYGLEIQPAYAQLAQSNARALGIAMTVYEGDVAAEPADLRAISVDHVIANPPYYADEASSATDDPGKDRAFRGAAPLKSWIDCGLRRLRDGGWLTIVQRVERLPDMLGALAGRAGAIAVLPIAARAGHPASRVILRARKGAAAPLALHPPFVMHDGERHERDGDGFSVMAERILRDCDALEF